MSSLESAYLGLSVSQFRRVLGACGITVILLTHVWHSLMMYMGTAIVYVLVLLMQKRMATACGLMAATETRRHSPR